MTVLDRKLITRMVNPQPGGNGGGGGYVPQSQDVSWTDINGKPTTLSGYGITDAYWATTQSTSDKRNLTIGSVTQQVITAHQSLSGYATEYWVGQQGYATQTWVGNNYLPLAGGTMTGQLGLISNAYSGASPFSYGLNCNNSDIIGVNSIYMNDTSDGWDEGIEFKRNNNNWDSLYALDGTFYFMANNGSGYADVHAYKGIAEDTWSSKSDARLKNVLGDVNLTVEQIAAMPAVRFEWKNRNDHLVHVGTLAQDVQKVLPEVVGQTDGGILTVAYSEAAWVSVVKVAQRVLELEKLIKHGTHQ